MPTRKIKCANKTINRGESLVAEAFIFPWATEGATRPVAPGDADLAPFSPAWLQSILYSETDPEAKAGAVAKNHKRAHTRTRQTSHFFL